MDVEEKTRETENLDAVRQGDHEAFERLVLLYSPKLFRVANALLGNREDAEEVVQDAFVRAYKALGSFRGESSFETWMHRITLNLARNRFHWNKRRGEGKNISLSAPPAGTEEAPEAQDWELPDVKPAPDRALEHVELEKDIDAILDSFSSDLRETMRLRHAMELSYEAIAEKMGVPVGTVKSRIGRARELLRRELVKRENIAGGKTRK